MPPLGLLVGGVNFTDLKLELKPAEMVDGVMQDAVTLNYGNFLQTAIIALSIFLFVKLIGKLMRKKEEEPAAPPAPSKEEQLLTEIRDLLKKQSEK